MTNLNNIIKIQNPNKYVVDKISARIEMYLEAFNLTNSQDVFSNKNNA